MERGAQNNVGITGKHVDSLVLVGELFLVVMLIPLVIAYFDGAVTVDTLNYSVGIIVLMISLVFVYCLSCGRLKERFSLLSFSTVFFFIIMGRYVTGIGNGNFWGSFTFRDTTLISLENEALALLFIAASILTVYISYQAFRNNQKTVSKRSRRAGSTRPKVEYWCKLIMYIGAIPAFIKVIGKVAYVLIYGYLGTYVTDGSAFFENAFIDLFDKAYILGFLGYIATFPKRDDIKFPIILFLIYSFLSLLTGVRGEFVINLLFLLWYFSKRDLIYKDEQIITRGRMLFVVVFALVLAMLLLDYGYIRFGQAASSGSVLARFAEFTHNQGTSGRLIALSLEESESILAFMSPLLILFSPVRNFLINNAIVRLVGGGVYGQSLNSLLAAPGFGSVLTYVTNPQSYLNGSGVGTCYIAEMGVAFGIVGVVAVNILLGFAFYKLDTIESGNWALNVFLFNTFIILVYIPRHATLGIIPDSVSLLLFIVLISILSRSKQGDEAHCSVKQ